MNWLGWVKSKLKTKIGKKCIFECKHDCPKSMYIEFGLEGLNLLNLLTNQTCEHSHEAFLNLNFLTFLINSIFNHSILVKILSLLNAFKNAVKKNANLNAF
jgi:hypothetical protein